MKTLNSLLLACAAAVALPVLGGCAHHDRNTGYRGNYGDRHVLRRGDTYSHGQSPWINNDNRTGGGYGYNSGMGDRNYNRDNRMNDNRMRGSNGDNGRMNNNGDNGGNGDNNNGENGGGS